MTDANTPRRVTICDIARRLGVSQATVSLALRDDPQISISRRAEVKQTAAEMGYRPDPMLSALNRYRHEVRAPGKHYHATLAWINRWRRPEALRKLREFDEYWFGAQEFAEAHGFHLEEIVWHEKISGARLGGILSARGIQGILIPPSERSLSAAMDGAWDDFRWTDFSAVRLGRSIHAPGVPVVAADQVHNCRLAMAEIRRRGYRHIGFATSRSMTVFTLSLAGFLMAQTELPEAERVPPLVMDETKDITLETWLSEVRPDAILTDSPEVAEQLTTRKPCSPDSPGLAVLSVQDGGADTGIDQLPREIGRTAVDVLISQLGRHTMGIPSVGREMLVQGRWVDGDTLAPHKWLPILH